MTKPYDTCATCPGLAWEGYVPPSHSTMGGGSILLLGMAPAEREITLGRPFVGPSGELLDAMFSQAGIVRSRCTVDNVVRCRPPGNELSRHCPAAYEACRQGTDHIIQATRPNLVVAFGNEPLQVMAGLTGIMSWRGSVIWSDRYGCKVIPVLHPSYFLNSGDWTLFRTTIGDLKKAAREASSPVHQPWMEDFLLGPGIEEIEQAFKHIRDSGVVTVDLEIDQGAIVYLGLAWSKHDAICIPLARPREDGQADLAYPAEETELIWKLFHELMSSPVVKVFQNGADFDIPYLHRYGIYPTPPIHDTIHLHHLFQAELPHGLAFMASTLTAMSYWKHLGRAADEKEEDK